MYRQVTGYNQLRNKVLYYTNCCQTWCYGGITTSWIYCPVLIVRHRIWSVHGMK